MCFGDIPKELLAACNKFDVLKGIGGDFTDSRFSPK